ncbi:hypothetical protein C8J57DRAFT_1469787 [Mycena rebaudengoi]|nr:hypothetical protein C8J57DRAFT_1469787 [Mycena rebaudengoi]
MRIEAGAGLLVSFQAPLDALPAKVLENDTHQLLSDLETASKRYDTLQRAFRDCHFALRELRAALGPSSPTFTAPLPANPHTALTAKQHAALRNAVERLHNCTEDERVELEMRVADKQVPARGIATTILQLQPGSASGVKTSSMRGWGISSVGRGMPWRRGDAMRLVPLLQHLHVSHHAPFAERAFAVLPTALRTLTMSHYYGLWTYAEPAVAFMAALVVCISTSSREIARVEASDGDGRHIVLPGCGGVYWCCGKGWGGSTPALDIARQDSLSALSPEVHHFPIKSVSEMVEHEKGDNVACSTMQNEHGDYLKDYGTQRFVPFGTTKAMIQKNSDNGRVFELQNHNTIPQIPCPNSRKAGKSFQMTAGPTTQVSMLDNRQKPTARIRESLQVKYDENTREKVDSGCRIPFEDEDGGGARRTEDTGTDSVDVDVTAGSGTEQRLAAPQIIPIRPFPLNGVVLAVGVDVHRVDGAHVAGARARVRAHGGGAFTWKKDMLMQAKRGKSAEELQRNGRTAACTQLQGRKRSYHWEEKRASPYVVLGGTWKRPRDRAEEVPIHWRYSGLSKRGVQRETLQAVKID